MSLFQRISLVSLALRSCSVAVPLLLGASEATPQLKIIASGQVEPEWPVFGIEVNHLEWAGNDLGLGISNHAVKFSASRGFALPLVATGNVYAHAGISWQGGLQVGAQAEGAAGPFALKFSTLHFTQKANYFDPLSFWTYEPTDTREEGWNTTLRGRYRVARQWIAQVDAELRDQTNIAVVAEYRHDLNKVTPPAPEDGPDAEPLVERIGTLSGRGGVRCGTDVVGALAGLSYMTEAGLELEVDVLAGAAQEAGTFGITASAAKDELLGENSNLRAYVAYEPWRINTASMRVGLEAQKTLGPGQIALDIRTGQTLKNELGWGLRLGYSMPLNNLKP